MTNPIFLKLFEDIVDALDSTTNYTGGINHKELVRKGRALIARLKDPGLDNFTKRTCSTCALVEDDGTCFYCAGENYGKRTAVGPTTSCVNWRTETVLKEND